MSPEALAQRKAAGNSPTKAEGMKGNRNGWKHGSYVTNFINKLKPCKSTCPQYPCLLVEEEGIEPGDDCLDKVEVVQFFRAVNDAIKNKKYDDFNELAALQIGNTFKIIDMLTEDIMRDGTVVKREKRDANGNLIIEYVTHPSLLAFPKLIADLGLNPAEFLITPRAISRVEDDEKAGKTIGDAMKLNSPPTQLYHSQFFTLSVPFGLLFGLFLRLLWLFFLETNIFIKTCHE